VRALVKAVASAPARRGVFNPWVEVDREHDLGPASPGIRRRHLAGYLRPRAHRSRLVLIGEALGYQGGHFSGIAMTSERILLGHKSREGIPAAAVLPAPAPRRSSSPRFKPLGFSEPTGTIVWKQLLGLGLDPFAFVLWNAFPWHPFSPGRGMLSNRRPTAVELASGEPVLRRFLEIFPGAVVLAVGRVAEAVLRDLGVAAVSVRHPANGGAVTFRRQIGRLLSAEGT